MTYQNNRKLSSVAAASGRRALWFTASVLAIAAAGAASAQTTVLTSASPNYDLVAKAGVDQYVELSSGTQGWLLMGDSHGYSNSGNPIAPVPAGGVGILTTVGGWWQNSIGSEAPSSWCCGWFLTKNNAPIIKVDSGATLTFAGAEVYGFTQDYHFFSMVQSAGTTVFGASNYWRFWGTNTFNNMTLLNGATFDSGGNIDGWGCCGTGATNTVNGWFGGSATSTVNVLAGSLTVNGVTTAANPFLGVVNVSGTLVVGDSTHSSAVFGDPVGKTATFNIVNPTSTVSGYGTIAGNVTNNGIIRAGGTAGVNGGLTINGNLTLHGASILKTSLTPTGVSGLTVNGNLAAAGELDIQVASGTYGNAVFPVIAVNGGTLSGAFSTVATAGAADGVILGLLTTPSGFSIVTEKGSASQIYGHLMYADRMQLTDFVGSVYDAAAITPESGAKLDTWATVNGGIENLGHGGLGYEEKSLGLSFGALHRFERHGGVLGAAFQVRRGNLAVKNDPATAVSNGYDFAIHGGADVNELRFEGSAFYNLFDAHTKRPMGSFGTSQSGERGYSYGFSGQISHDMFGGRVAPYARGTYARVHLKAAKEHGSLQYDLQHDGLSVNTFVTELGLHAHLLRPQPDQRFRVDAVLAWRYDLSDPGETVSGSFANFSSGKTVSFWKGDSKNALVVGVNGAGQITDRLEIYGRLDGTVTSYRRAGELSAGVKYKF